MSPSWWHIPKESVIMMEWYIKVKANMYAKKMGVSLEKAQEFVNRDDGHFFVNSAFQPFASINLKNISGDLGVDVVSYDFRCLFFHCIFNL